jgi:predicted transposase/invertase (TIGR01784 family)
MSEYPTKSHDEFFKSAFSRLKIARAYLEEMLPEAVTTSLDLNSLERENGSYVDQDLQEHITDMVYQCKLKLGQTLLWITFIFEHKSSPERYPHLQLLRYILGAWEQQRKQKLPISPIIPIIVYHGKKKWKKRDLKDYFGVDLPENLLPYLPRFEYFLTSVQDLSDGQIIALKAGLLINTLLMLKHIWETDFILEHPQLMFAHLKQETYDGDFITSIVAYIFKNTEISKEKVKKFFAELPQTLNEEFMSTYGMIKEEGVIEGLEEGRKEGLEEGREQIQWNATREMLLKNIDENMIQVFLEVDQAFIALVRAELQYEQQNQ